MAFGLLSLIFHGQHWFARRPTRLPPSIVALLLSLFFASALALALTGAISAQSAVTQPGSPAGSLTVPPWPETLPLGVAAGDVTTDSVVLWTVSRVPGVITFTLSSGQSITGLVHDPKQPVTVVADELIPGTFYVYTVENGLGERMEGYFQTAADQGHQGLHFGVSGDWRGELAPFPSLSNVAERNLDFFVALGDTVYADVPTLAVPDGPATTAAEFRAKYVESLSPHYGGNTWVDIRRSTALFATIDDHEVRNDFAGGALARTSDHYPETTGRVNQTELYVNGLQAFRDYHPLAMINYRATGDSRFNGRPNLYRYRRFGQDAALFVLDARSFRDAAVLQAANIADIPRFLRDAFAPNRTLLGAVQLAQLKQDLLDAQARGVTWKFVAIPQPIQNLGHYLAADRYEGYAAERADLLAFINAASIQNVVFIAADIHGSVTNNLTYQNAPHRVQVPTNAWEVTVGPVAYPSTFGPAVVGMATYSGLISENEREVYAALNDRSARDAYTEGILNHFLAYMGYDLVGLGRSNLIARLWSGGYSATHSLGWTEFEINAQSQRLVVTTWGIDPYSAAQLAADPVAVLSREPAIVSQFVVKPQLEPAEHAMATESLIYLPWLVNHAFDGDE